MSHTRREFIKDVAVAGAVLSAGSAMGAVKGDTPISDSTENTARCPYFDQPLYCKGLSEDGKPLCEK
jgi:hypothetical protein